MEIFKRINWRHMAGGGFAIAMLLAISLAGHGGGAAAPKAAAHASPLVQDAQIPRAAYAVVAYAASHNGAAQDGFVGDRPFADDGRGGGEILPRHDGAGRLIRYREYDIRQYRRGVNRGAERVIIGSDGSAYYTHDHYRHFTRLQ